MEKTMKKYYSALLIVLFFFILFSVVKEDIHQVSDNQKETYHVDNQKDKPKHKKRKKSLYAGTSKWLGQNLSKKDKQNLIQAFTIQEQEVYTFLQGPKSWGEGVPWSGEWCTFNVRGNPFGGFGCGLCCMANIYDTLSPYEVSPWDMYEYAISVSSYAPDGKHGAIDWKDMRDALRKCGINCKLYKKPNSYKIFKEQMAKAKSAVVLISSNNDDTYWQNTPGHYVNIWLYQEENETVFLADPGNPDNNRVRIPLRYIYDALKTISKFQYLKINGYLEEDNQWKADSIHEKWNRPKDL